MIKGYVIADSLRAGAELKPGNWRVTRIRRVSLPAAPGPGQPSEWTIIEFEAGDGEADALAAALSGGLKHDGGWYTDFRVDDDHLVIFADRVFRYRRGDHKARAEAVRYGKSVGVPAHQLDWPD